MWRGPGDQKYLTPQNSHSGAPKKCHFWGKKLSEFCPGRVPAPGRSRLLLAREGDGLPLWSRGRGWAPHLNPVHPPYIKPWEVLQTLKQNPEGRNNFPTQGRSWFDPKNSFGVNSFHFPLAGKNDIKYGINVSTHQFQEIKKSRSICSSGDLDELCRKQKFNWSSTCCTSNQP